MSKNVPAIPQGFHTVTPYLIVKGAAAAIEFYERAFGADVVARQDCEQSGLVLNAKLAIGDSIIMISDELPAHGCCGPRPDEQPPVTIHLYVEDVDAAFDRAVKAGAEPVMPVSDVFWGDRYGQLRDPFHHSWSIATHIEDLTPEQMAARAREAFAAP
jgi:uncharacterized glyoxalase superfamily protein PhnB